MNNQTAKNENIIRLSGLLEENMMQFPLVARKIIYATRDKRSGLPYDTKLRLLQALESGQITPSEISRIMCISKPNVTTLITKLIDDGLAQRSHDEKDRRVINVAITEKGRKALQRYRLRVKKYLLKAFEKFSEDELKDTIVGMEKFNNIMVILDRVI
jgi:DNA-binding MarR family transcriptional regulator